MSDERLSPQNELLKPLRILHISTALDWRGGEQQLLLLHRELLAMGHESAVYCPNDSVLRKKIEAEGSACIPCPGHKASIRRLSQSVRDHRPDLISLHDPNAHTAAVKAQLLRFIDQPMVLHRKVDFALGRNPLSRFKYGHPSIRAVIAVSEAVRRVLQASGAVRAPIEVVRDAFDPRRIHGGHRPRFMDAEVPVYEREWLVGTVAAFADHKDPETFIRAARMVQNRFPKARFVWLGEGRLRSKALQMASEAGIRFEAPGFVEDVIERMRLFDVLMYSSKEEGLGSSLIDAMALGLPIASTAAGGIPELFEHGGAALLSEVKKPEALASHVMRILEDSGLRQSLSDRARAESVHFGARAYAEQTLAIYRRALSWEEA